jgi:hypothetical protein
MPAAIADSSIAVPSIFRRRILMTGNFISTPPRPRRY